LARAEAEVASARAHLHDQVGRLWDVVCSGGRPTVAQRADVRLACTSGAAAARSAVDRCFAVAGGSAVYLSSPLQRCLRDIHVACQHAMLSPRLLETWSKLRLGLDADTGML
jgi:alkylation response protein AidB-like acyl-CoA dehydrogenase